jgi:transcriptional regulator with XRE-family HTH domain
MIFYLYIERNLAMNVGERIRYFRTLKGYTTNKLANLSGISQSYLRDVELGNKNPTIETLSYVCDALNISLHDFFNEKTQNAIQNDLLIEKIYQLSEEQRNALLVFLNSIT